MQSSPEQNSKPNTNGVNIKVTVDFEKEVSRSDEYNCNWIYNVKIVNQRKVPIQLVKRKWFIVDEEGHSVNVEGEGVVGQRPIIKPADQFNYSSQVSLQARSGMMVGKYHFIELKNGKMFWVEIPAFSLDHPEIEPVIN